MSTNGNGKTRDDETLQEIEARILEEFPIEQPGALHRLLVRQAAKTELYHRAVESTVEDVAAVRETVRRLPCMQTPPVPRCPEGAE